MSILSKFLGLDSHPAVLASLNEIGHQLAPIAISKLPTIASLEDELSATIDAEIGALASSLHLGDTESGLLKWYVSTQLKAKIAAVVAKYEPSIASVVPSQVVVASS